jgi:hypothetical protein
VPRLRERALACADCSAHAFIGSHTQARLGREAQRTLVMERTMLRGIKQRAERLATNGKEPVS